MEVIDRTKLSKLQVEVLDEYLDLLSMGYLSVFAFYDDSFWFIKIKHRSNGRTLTLHWNPTGACIKEKRKTLKVF